MYYVYALDDRSYSVVLFMHIYISRSRCGRGAEGVAAPGAHRISCVRCFSQCVSWPAPYTVEQQARTAASAPFTTASAMTPPCLSNRCAGCARVYHAKSCSIDTAQTHKRNVLLSQHKDEHNKENIFCCMHSSQVADKESRGAEWVTVKEMIAIASGE